MNKEEIRSLVGDFFARTGRLLSNGVPLISALEVIAAESGESVFGRVVRKISRSVEFGKTFAAGLRGLSLFPESLITAVSAGEERGVLDEQLIRLSDSVVKGDFPLGPMPETASLSGDPSDETGLSIPELVDDLLRKAFQAGASDLHIDPIREGGRVRFRVDGVLHDRPEKLTKTQHQAVVSRIKILAGLDAAERKLPQDGRLVVPLEREAGSEPVRADLRVSVCPYVLGEKVAVRTLDSTRLPYTLDQIMEGDKLEKVRGWLKNRHGLILANGPTGSGKTTTLLLMLKELTARGDKNILSVEDPVEFLLEGVNQMQVRTSLGLTFTAAIRSFLRQDPDVVSVGEIRDPETAQSVVKAARTGHLLLSQLHTSDGVAAASLLREVGVPVYLLRQIPFGVISQRLVRRLCPNCKKALSDEEKRALPEPYRSLDGTFYEAVGCSECAGIGYKGRIALYEIYEPAGELWNLLSEGVPEEKVREELAGTYETLRDDASRKVAEGVTSFSEIERGL